MDKEQNPHGCHLAKIKEEEGVRPGARLRVYRRVGVSIDNRGGDQPVPFAPSQFLVRVNSRGDIPMGYTA